MIKRRNVKETVKVTFALPKSDPRLPASVVGDFNGWRNDAHPLLPRSNDTCSAVVTLAPGCRYEFRYRSADGIWFDDDQADHRVANEHGSTNGVVLT